MRCAIDTLHGEGLFLGLAFAQVLHQAVVDVVGPGAVSRDAQAAQCIRARGDAGRVGLERHLISPVYISHGQHAGIGQYIWAGIFSHSADVVTRDNGCIIDGGNSSGNTACRAVHTIGNGVFKRDITVEIRGWRKDQLAITQGDGTITDRYCAAFGNGLAIDGGNSEAITIRVCVVAKHINGDGAVLLHAELVVAWQGGCIHHAVVGSLG